MKRLRVFGWFLLVPGAAAVLLLVVLTIFTGLQTTAIALIGISTFIPWMWLPCCVAIVGLALVLNRQWRLLAVAPAVAVVAVWAVPLIPTSQATADPSGPPDFTVVNLNLQYGRADARELAAQVGPDTDVVVLQEYTPSYTAELEAVGLLDDFPYREGTERTDAGGTMVLSRTPLEIDDRTDTAFDNLVVRLELAGVTWQVAAIHSTPPHFGAEAWTQDAFKVNALIMKHQEENLVIVGDFNAIVGHHPMRILLKNPNIIDPMAGRTGPDRFQPTWPVGKAAPRFAKIDHFFTSAQVLPQVPHHFAVAGTDHLGITASVWLP